MKMMELGTLDFRISWSSALGWQNSLYAHDEPGMIANTHNFEEIMEDQSVIGRGMVRTRPFPCEGLAIAER